MMNRKLQITALLLIVGFFSRTEGHVDNPYLPEGCGSCHVGHGIAQQPMLEAAEEEFCYQCHGSEGAQSKMQSAGRLAGGIELANIEREFAKPYRHPVVEGFGHSPTEKLPSATGASASHAECVDCHNPHQRITVAATKVYDVAGYSLAGQYTEKATNEYEICLKCHAGNFLLDEPTKNLRRQFSLTVRSQHPVTKVSVGTKSPSLTMTLGAEPTMKCSDCHTGDGPNAPRGPHGSNFRYLLSGNYETGIYVDENPLAYQFCYSCHDRSSILNNESFPLHQQHLLGNPEKNIKGTSCFTCHASHGSQNYPHLIRFNPDAVDRGKSTGRLDYISNGDGSGQCYLMCHGHEHRPGRY